MSENIGVTDWFTKKRSNVDYPTQSDKMLDKLVAGITDTFNTASKMSDVADGIYDVFERDPFLKSISSDSRFPVCSLFHHLKNTSGIAVCLLIQKMEDDSSYVQKCLDAYNIGCEYDKKDFIALLRVAALLHDIGKPRSYTSDSKYQQFHYHTKQGKEIIDDILSRTTSKLVERFELKKILPLLASRHHGRDVVTDLERLLSTADTVASAADRVNEIEAGLDLKNGMLKVSSHDRIFPHELNFDAGGLKCLDTPHTVILGNGSIQVKKVKPKDANAISIQLFVDNTTGGGPVQYLGSSSSLKGKIGILSLDMTGIQGFIGEAEKLKMLRGGSFLVSKTLELAADVISKHVCKEAVLFVGGGNLLSFMPDTPNYRELLKREIKKCISDESKEGLKAAVVAFSIDIDDVAHAFDKVLERSQELLDIEKNRTYHVPSISDKKEICKFCSTRPLPASAEMCEVCTVKNQRGESEKWGLSKRYIENTYGASRPTELSHLGNSIGVLMVDGNMMGRMFQQTTTPAEYTFKSQSFGSRFDEILKNTIADFLKNEQVRRDLVMVSREDGNYLGMEVVYAGGDDILILMNAKGIIQFAEILAKNIAGDFKFQKKFHDTKVFSNPVVTVSCGIAIADHKFPIYFLLDAARKMESKAKEIFRGATFTDELGIIRLPEGAIAITGISSAMPSDNSSCFVLGDGGHEESFVQLKGMISIALNKKSSRALLSDLITCGDSELERLNLIKYMYTSLQRKSSDIGLDDCEWMAGILKNTKVLGASRMIIPHLLHGSEEGSI
ncbi:MAG: hypothetical protein PWR29_840 [Methanolobus sp.]|nr:hypothetical protein [Methanolobus sp.]MDK2911883.1 hypothetical protein [Methanolobus sp.]MDN5310560.1 hypothetical protein [Methanolobus sp.]